MAFSYRYSEVGLVIPGAVNDIAYGTTMKDDAAGHTINAGNRPGKTNRRGRNQIGFIFTNAGGFNCNSANTAGGFNTVSCGIAMVCQWGVQGRVRRAAFGTTDFGASNLFVSCGATGCLTLDSQNGANAVAFGDALPIPCNETILMIASGAGGTFGYVHGLPTATGAVFGISATPFGTGFYDSVTGRCGACFDAIDVYTTSADITGSYAAKAASLAAEFGIVTPTDGTGVILADSIGTGAYSGFCNSSFACDIASGSASLKRIFWKNNSESGVKLSDFVSLADGTRTAAYTAKVTDSVNWPVSGKKIIVVALGTNDLGAGVSSANMLTLAGYLAQRLREDHPTAAIVFNAVLVRGTTAALNTIRLAYNNGLAAAIAPYRGIYNDPASGVTEFNPANNDGAITAATAASAFQTYDGSNVLGAGDRLHPGPAGANLLRAGFVAGAQDGFDSLASPARRLHIIDNLGSPD